MTKQKEKFWTTPNMLSLSRIPLSIIFVTLLLNNKLILAITTLALIALTDFLDGYTARKLKQTSKIGEMLDQISDKISILAVLVILFIELKLPAYILLILTRDVIVVIFATTIYLKKKIRGVIIKPSIYGKIVTTLQFVTLIIILVKPEITKYLVTIIFVLSIIALIDYYKKLKRIKM